MGLMKKIKKAATEQPDMYGRRIPDDETPEERKKREDQTALNTVNAAAGMNINNG